jgi:hypothetical protein
MKEHTNVPSNNNDRSLEKNMSNSCKFKQQWLEIKEYQPWLREVVHDEQLFFCFFCEKYMTAKLPQIYRHAESTAHIRNVEKKNIEKTDENITTDESLLSFDERKKAAEIKFAAFIAEKNIAHQAAKEILTLFQEIGKDYNVLKSMSMGRTKCKNILSNVLCPVETNRVVDIIQNTKFTIFVDETSDICNQKWMTFLVRYVHPETLDVCSQLVKLINLDARDCSADKLFEAFKCEMYKLQIPFTNIIALSCDNAHVMRGKNLSFQKKLEKFCTNLITFSCPCHSAALVANIACRKIPDYCEDFVKKLGYYINSSPKRSAILKNFVSVFRKKTAKF